MSAYPPLESVPEATSAGDSADAAVVLQALSRLQASDRRVQLVADLESRQVLHLEGPVLEILGIEPEVLCADPSGIADWLEGAGGVSLHDLWRQLLERGRLVALVRAVRRSGEAAPLRAVAELVTVGARRLVAVSVASVPSLCVTATALDRVTGEEDRALFCDVSQLGTTPPQAFRRAMDFAQEGLAVTDRAGNFVYLNRAFVRMFGYDDASELLGRSWRLRHEPRCAPELALAESAVNAVGSWRGEIVTQRRDGSEFHQSMALSRLPDGGLVYSCHDRSEKVALMRRLSHSEALFRRLLNSLAMAVLIRRMDGPFEFANEQFGRFAGAAPETFVGATTLGEIGRQGLDAIQQYDHEVAGKESGVEFDHPLSWRGQELVLRVTKFALAIQGEKDSHVCTIIRDITRQRRLEDEERAAAQRQKEYMEMQREFISMVSHEFRTPLTAIQGAHYLLNKKLEGAAPALRAELDRMLKLQEGSIAALKELVDQVLLLNRIDHMTTDAVQDAVDIGASIDRVVACFNDAVDAPRVKFEAAGRASVVATVQESLLRTALENLISNGLKYSAHDSPVTVSLRTRADGWQIDVGDRGRGIPLADQAKLAQSFFRASNVGTVAGTGLGLTIVKRVMDFHGARMEFKSEVGVGSTFSLVFPAASSPPPPPP